MVKGIGIDIIEIERISKVIKERGDKFLARIFTEKEVAYCRGKTSGEVSFAGRFAAKEAVAKALGTGFKGFNMRDIEIEISSEGVPKVILWDKASDIAAQQGINQILVSISHSREYAIASAIALGTGCAEHKTD